VSGNLELRARQGIALDLDGLGVPDPLMALAREAREELGLVIDSRDIAVTGVARFWNPTERGTHVLLTTTNLPLTAQQVADRVGRGDLVEGLWEVGTELCAVSLPENEADSRALVVWLLTDPELTPHAAAAGMAALGLRRHIPAITSALAEVRGTYEHVEMIRLLL